MLLATKKTISVTAALICTAPLFGAPVRDFADAHVVADALGSAQNDGAQNIGIAPIGNIDEPQILASFGGPAMTPAHIKPTKPITPDFGNGVSTGSSPNTKATVIVPLPAPAGLAVAGLVLIGSIRRR